MSIHEQARAEAEKKFPDTDPLALALAMRDVFQQGFHAGHEAATRTRVVTTVDELDALPVGSVVLDRHGYPWLKGTGSWVCTSDGGVIEPHEVTPLTVLYDPEETP